jgi:hypothetical protein
VAGFEKEIAGAESGEDGEPPHSRCRQAGVCARLLLILGACPLGCLIVLSWASHDPKRFRTVAVIYPVVADFGLINRGVIPTESILVPQISTKPQKSLFLDHDLIPFLGRHTPVWIERGLDGCGSVLRKHIIFRREILGFKDGSNVGDRIPIIFDYQPQFLPYKLRGRSAEILNPKRAVREAIFSRKALYQDGLLNLGKFLPHWNEKPRTFGVDKSLDVQKSSIRLAAQNNGLNRDKEESWEAKNYEPPFGGCVPPWRAGLAILCIWGSCIIIWKSDGKIRPLIMAFVIGRVGTAVWFTGKTKCQCGQSKDYGSDSFHTSITVPQKYMLTSITYRGTVIPTGRTQMANILPMEKQVAAISA